jgi:Hemerythrin HHE cation binding domain
MPDITRLIMDDHAWFRDQFAALDELQARSPLDVDAVREVWTPLAARLDVHAIAEERIFYPQLLRLGEDPEGETLDAIGDHNEIRDGVHEAARHPLGTAEWWAAVGQARKANDEHMGEEEREGLSDFRLHAPVGLRDALGAQFSEFLDAHRTTAGLDTADKDPDEYVAAVEREIHAADPEDISLGIGSLKEN